MARKSNWNGTLAGLNYNSNIDDKINDLFEHFDIQGTEENSLISKITKKTRVGFDPLSRSLSEYCTTASAENANNPRIQEKTEVEKLKELVIALSNKQKIPAFTVKPIETQMKDCLIQIEEIVFWYEIRLFAFKNYSSIQNAIKEYLAQKDIRLEILLIEKRTMDKTKEKELALPDALLKRYNRIQAENLYVMSLNSQVEDIIKWASEVAKTRPDVDKNITINYLCYNLLQKLYPNDCHYVAYKDALEAFKKAEACSWAKDS